VTRKEIIDRKKNVAIEELIYREDMAMFWTGGSRVAHCLLDYLRLFSQILATNNWHALLEHLKEINVPQFGMEMMSTWGSVSTLWKQAQYAAAGKAMADGLFPTKYESVGNIKWEPLPYDAPYSGEEVAGYVNGTIKALTGETTPDTLAECLAD